MPHQFIHAFVALVFALSVGCGSDDSPNRAATTSADTPVKQDFRNIAEQTSRLREEFLKIADQLEHSHNPYLGREQLGEIEKQLREPLDVESIVNKLLQLCWHQLRLGDIEAAQTTIASAFSRVEANDGMISPSMLKLRALVNLRQAEQQNCIQRHNRDCCLFPIQGEGVHADATPIIAAHQLMLQWHEANPRDLEAAWLLNITSMARGDYPDGIPEYLRLPQQLFESQNVIKRFVDIAGPLGVDTFNLCGGAIVDDFDGDHLLDIVTSTYDPRGELKFYRNNGKGSFDDASDESQLAVQFGGLNCIAADYDNDGDLDILVLRGAWLKDDGQIRNSLLQNDGSGKFRDVTKAAGLATPVYPTQAAVWNDFDNDGYLDLYIGNESRVEFDSTGDFPAQLFHNDGNGSFTDIARQAGVTNDRYCKGVSAGDFDNDGDQDIYVSNRGKNRLYRNEGHNRFSDVAETANVIEPSQHSFATWFFDYDNDGWLDLFVAAYQSTNADVAADYFGLPHSGVSPRLYRNLGDGTFQDVAQQVGLDRAFLPMGANFGDLDNDGFLDIYLTTGRPDFATLTPNVMLRNDQGRRFQDVSFEGGFGHLQKGHGVAFADIDNDGDQDIYHQLGGFYPGDKFHNALFHNPGNEHQFVTIKLIGTDCNRQAVGARIRIVTQSAGGDREYYRAVGVVSSFGGSTIRQEIGLSNAETIRQIDIDWPGSSSKQTLTDAPMNSFIVVTQNEPGFRVLQLPRILLDGID